MTAPKKKVVAAHAQATTNHYTVHYPPHPPRESDPHYRDFEAYRRRTKDTAQCSFGLRRGGDFSECGGGLELHHSHIEFSMQNGVDPELLEPTYPGISKQDIGAWIETAANLEYLCEKHHRGAGGVHHASASDYEAAHFVRGLIS